MKRASLTAYFSLLFLGQGSGWGASGGPYTFNPTDISGGGARPTSSSYNLVGSIGHTGTNGTASSVSYNALYGFLSGAKVNPPTPGPAMLLSVSPEVTFAIGLGNNILALRFSEPMDTGVDPTVTFGQASPYTDFVLAASTGWSADGLTWYGWIDIDGTVPDGVHRIRVSGAVSDAGFALPDDTSHTISVEKIDPNDLYNGMVTNAGVNALEMAWDPYTTAKKSAQKGAPPPPDPIGYFILRADAKSGPFGLVEGVPITETNFIDVDLVENKTYYYKVYVLLSNLSAHQLTITFQGTTLLRLNGGQATALSPSEILVTWNPSLAGDVLNVEVFRSRTLSPGSFSSVAVMGPSMALFNDLGLKSNTVYHYLVLENLMGGGTRTFENPVSAKTFPLPDTPPPVSIQNIPDIRHAVSPVPILSEVLDLNEYLVSRDRYAASGKKPPIKWSEKFFSGLTEVIISNELQILVPGSLTPTSEVVILSASDGIDTYEVDPLRVKTVDFLLGGPLVDDFLYSGTPYSTIPYQWCVSEASPVTIPLFQPSTGGGQLTVNVSDGLGSSTIHSDSSALGPAKQLSPRAPYLDPINILGSNTGPLSGVSLVAGNLSVQASTEGLVIEAQPGFADWARVTLTRSFDNGSEDCYTVAITEVLQGASTDLDGFAFTGIPTLSGLAGSEDFEGITLVDFLGVADSAAYNALSTGGDAGVAGARSAQTTTWDVRPLNPTVGNSGLAPLAITSTGKPAATFPGATSGQALKVDFTQQDGQGIIAFHKGIPSSSYNPGDVLTFSLNSYFDLNYNGVNDDAINDGQNGFVFAMALGDALTLSMGNFNYIDFPPTDAAVNDPNAPVGSANYTNKEAILHGRWTRHQVSWRVPEIGQSVTGGPNGTGDLVDPTGVGAAWTVQRGDTAAPVNQTVWLDNLCIAACPGPLSLALGSIQVPMISAGYAFEYNGANSTFYGFFGGTDHPQPAAINRGAAINGNFSTNAGSSSLAFPAASPSLFFRAAENAAAGWIDSAVGSAPGYIVHGDSTVALGFPTGFDDSLAAMSSASTVSRTKTPYLDMALIDQALIPGLRVDTITFAGGSGGGPSTLNQIVNNVSGIFGVRFSARTDGAAPSANAQVNVVLSNADVNCGMVSQVGPQMLPNGADAIGAGAIWADYFLEGSMTTFHSPQNFAVAQQSSHSAITAALNADNPGAQLAQVEIIRAPYAGGLLGLQNTGLGNGYETFMGEVAPAGSLGSGAQQAAVPGAAGDSNMFIDEVGLYTVRDAFYMYDEDLCLGP